jgi:hypothetical protein
MTALLLNWNGSDLVVPTDAQADMAVAPNFERFSGIENSPPVDHPGTASPTDTTGTGYQIMQDHTPRPGQLDQPIGQVYTPGPLASVVGVTGGQPYPVSPRVYKAPGAYTGVIAPSVQWRIGVGQSTAAGAQQTVMLSEITQNPPVPGDLTAIIAGLG